MNQYNQIVKFFIHLWKKLQDFHDVLNLIVQ